MSFIHYLFLGHFERDGEAVRFSKSPSDAAYKPVVSRPMDTQVIKTVLQESRGAKVNDLSFPDAWGIWMDDGYLVSDKYTTNQEAINFIAVRGPSSPAWRNGPAATSTTSLPAPRSHSMIGWP